MATNSGFRQRALKRRSWIPRTPYVNFELFDENRQLVFQVRKRSLKKFKKDIEEALGFKM